ncbi:MAG TPA: FAD-dependent oxidoreductase, partial [Bacteroidales bacterium]|nr:FAD-dependent oxidoreductase [Bacteroidales bacterium]
MPRSIRAKQPLKKVRLGGIREITAGVFFIWFNRDFSFNAGQVLGITDDPAVPFRLYSIASGENETSVGILFDIKEGGYLTPRLSKLSAGDALFITGPGGEFTCEQGPAYWIAAGTGIAPFASMFYTGLWKDKILIHGGRSLDRFYFEEDLVPVLNENYIRCCSAERGNGVFEGRLTTYLQLQPFLPPDRKYYLCGSAEMVVQTRDLLLSRGI